MMIDHDDTAVNSSAAVHYPAHLEALHLLRPGRTPPTLEEWLLCCFHGLMEHFEQDLALNREEMAQEMEIWRSWTGRSAPPFFPGFLDLLADFRARGGLVAVISHSEAPDIERHYRAAANPPFLPDLIFGWEHEAEKRKPSLWPVRETLRQFGCTAAEALIVDDLKPGVVMAHAAGIDIAAAGWSHGVPEIQEYMRAHATAYCASVDDLRAMIIPRPGLA